MNKIIGITGTNGAGKGTVVEILKLIGFRHFSAFDILIEVVNRLNMPQNRDSLIFVGNKLREEFGSEYVAEELIKKAQLSKGDAIIESIRTIGEVNALKNIGGILLSIDADQKLRFERIKKRGGVKDGVSWEEFAAQERGESESLDKNKQNLIGCKKMADFQISNNGSIKELEIQISDFLKKL